MRVRRDGAYGRGQEGGHADDQQRRRAHRVVDVDGAGSRAIGRG